MSTLHTLLIDHPALALAAGILVKATLLLTASFLIVKLLKNVSAAIRYLIWRIAFCGLLILPFLAGLPPIWHINLPFPETIKTVPLQQITSAGNLHNPAAKAAPEKPFASTETSPLSVMHEQKTAEKAPIITTFRNNLFPQWPFLLILVWGGAAVFILLKIALEIAGIWVLYRQGKTPEIANLSNLLTRLSWQLNLHRPVRVRTHAYAAVPVTFGARKPVILLPNTAKSWPEDRLKIVLQHELAHIKRNDYCGNLLMEIACAIYWFHPLVWLAGKKARLAREQACDDYVISLGTACADYARHLLEITRSLGKNPLSPRAIGMAGSNSNLKSRIQHILSEKIQRHGLTRSATILTAVLGGFFLLLISAIHFQKAVPLQAAPVMEKDTTVSQAVINLQSDNQDVQKKAAWLLGTHENHEAVAALIETLQDDNPEVRAMAAWALGEIKDHRAIAPLINALTDEDAYSREMIVRAIGEHENISAVPALKKMLSDSSADVRYAAVWALGEMPNTEALESVASALGDPHAAVRDMAVEVLGKRSFSNHFEMMLARLKDDDPQVRRHTAEILGKLKPQKAIVPLIEALADSDATVRQAAAISLGNIGHSDAVTALLAKLRDNAPEVRAAVVWALDEIEAE